MINKNKMLLFLLLIAFILTSCSEDMNRMENHDNIKNSPVQLDKQAENIILTDTATANLETNDFINQNKGNLEFNNAHILYDKSLEYNVYSAEYYDIDKETISSLFFPNKKVKMENIVDTIYNVRCDEFNGFLQVDADSLYFKNNNENVYNFLIPKYEIKNETYTDFVKQYHQKELDFCNQQEALAIVYAKIKTLTGLDVSESFSTVYGFNNNDLTEICKKKIEEHKLMANEKKADFILERIKDSLKEYEYCFDKLKENQNLQCLYIDGSLSYNCVPIINQSFNFSLIPTDVNSSGYVNPCEFSAIVSPKGLESLTITCKIKVQNKISEHTYEDLVSLESAKKTIENKYENMLVKTKIHNISLQYLFRPEKFIVGEKNYILTPVWCFKGEQEQNNIYQPYRSFMVLIDAVTGKEIV